MQTLNWDTVCVCVLLCLSSGLHPSEEHLKASYVTTLHEVCPSLKAPPDAPSSPCFWRMHCYDPSWPHKILCIPKKEERKKMAISRGVDRHFCVCVCVSLAHVHLLRYSVQLYDCSAGQSDCSQCRAVPEEYGCVWCPGSPSPSCVYNQSCSSVPADSCPPPQITQVSLMSLVHDRGHVQPVCLTTCLSAGVTCFWSSGGWSPGDNLRF